MKIEIIKYQDIKTDSNQPRKYFDEEKIELLKENIKLNGILEPLKVRFENNQYILIDGERRYKASKNILDELPCIIENPENVLEYQLISSCLKEDLTVDELDNAIYRLWEYYIKSDKTSYVRDSENERYKGYSFIGNKIGKSPQRVQKAIDRFEFKQNNQKFTENIIKKYNPTGKEYSKVNSTISMTDKIKDDEVRKKVIENVLEKRESKLENIDTPIIKEKIDSIIEKTKNIEDNNLKLEITEDILNNIDSKYNIDKDINIQFMEDLNDLRKAFIKLEGKEYKLFIDSISEQNLKEYNDLAYIIFSYFNKNLEIGE